MEHESYCFVWDQIPSSGERQGCHCRTRVLSKEEYILEMVRECKEEIQEFLAHGMGVK